MSKQDRYDRIKETRDRIHKQITSSGVSKQEADRFVDKAIRKVEK